MVGIATISYIDGLFIIVSKSEVYFFLIMDLIFTIDHASQTTIVDASNNGDRLTGRYEA